MKLQGKTIWITGAARRIGHAIAIACAKYGANIVVHYNTSPDEAEATAEEIHRHGGHAYLIKADLTSITEIQSAVDQVSSHWPKIDILIHNAAVFFPTPFGSTTEEEWNTTIDSNLKGPYFLTQALFPNLKKSPCPHVIFLGDIQCETPAARLVPYAITKMGLRAMVAGFKDVDSYIHWSLLELGPTLPPEDTRIKSPPITDTLDSVVNRVMEILCTN
ncbi:MAG: hypothetical protein COV45_03915 [Deltaproteobacteria bacterium CG11_big_fil_rev_8_21_14_0_20_47_16]|nr:MAG: hypothetical protein COV45_03915 [Deltaproteobacteria bacterium CG11_big_fil_rev_8_21_14_0_20_47_16]